MIINDVPWNLPLTVRLQNGLDRIFVSVYEATDFLENEWPLKHGPHYQRAVTTCRRALSRTTPAAVARETFVSACLEAGMTAKADVRSRGASGTEPTARV